MQWLFRPHQFWIGFGVVKVRPPVRSLKKLRFDEHRPKNIVILSAAKNLALIFQCQIITIIASDALSTILKSQNGRQWKSLALEKIIYIYNALIQLFKF
jgi:hypothetical protein